MKEQPGQLKKAKTKIYGTAEREQQGGVPPTHIFIRK